MSKRNSEEHLGFSNSEFADMEVKREHERADESNREFFMSEDSSDQMEREHNTRDEFIGNLSGSGDSCGSLHLLVSANLYFENISNDDCSSISEKGLSKQEGRWWLGAVGSLQMSILRAMKRVGQASTLHALMHGCQSSLLSKSTTEQ